MLCSNLDSCYWRDLYAPLQVVLINFRVGTEYGNFLVSIWLGHSPFQEVHIFLTDHLASIKDLPKGIPNSELVSSGSLLHCNRVQDWNILKSVLSGTSLFIDCAFMIILNQNGAFGPLQKSDLYFQLLFNVVEVSISAASFEIKYRWESANQRPKN